MKYATIEDILNIPQLDFYLNESECKFFMLRPNNQSDLQAFKEKYAYSQMQNLQTQARDIGKIVESNDSDAYFTSLIANVMRDAILAQQKQFSPDRLMLFLGGLAGKYLTWLDQAEKGKHKGKDEICFRDGEIIVVAENDIVSNRPDCDLNELKQQLAEGILIANHHLQNSKSKKLSISGTYIGRGMGAKNEELSFSVDKLEEQAKSKIVIENLPLNKFNDYIKQGLIKKWDIVKFINKGFLSKDDAIQLMINGVFTQEEVSKNIFKTNNLLNSINTKEISLKSKLLLYSTNRINIKTLEEAVVVHGDEEEPINKDELKEIAKYYVSQKNKINKISELLTHNVLDYEQSMQFLDSLVEEKAITDQEKKYLAEVMENFKTQELLNNIPNGGFKGGKGPGNSGESRGVTIDPIVRMQYLQSIGNVKQVFINGEILIRDESNEEKEKKTKNSLDGYELIIIPDKKIAVLEKFYETTRDKDGNIAYKKDANGRLIPAIENATYIMPIGMAKDFVEKKNKQQLRRSPYVRRAPHTMNWVSLVEGKMMEINPVAQFEVENTEKWAIEIANNYKKNLDAR